MRNQPPLIGKWEIFFITTVLLFNERILTIPRPLAEKFEQDSWIALILGGVIAIFFGLLFYLLIKRGNQEDLYSLIKKILGKPLGNIIIFILGCNLVINLGLSVRSLTDGIDSFLLDKTPDWVVMGTFLLIIIYMVNCGLVTMIHFYVLSFLITVIGMILIILMPLANFDLDNLLPILPEGIGRVMKGLPLVMTTYTGYEILGFILPKSEDKKLGLPFLGAIFFAMLLKTLANMGLITFFGVEELKHAIYPVVYMAKGIELQGLVFERAETIFALVWIPIAFNALSAQFFMLSKAVENFLPNLRMIISTGILGIIILIIAQIPKSVAENMLLSMNLQLMTLIFNYALLFILVLVAKIRGISANEQKN